MANLLLLLWLLHCALAQYAIQSNFSGATFFDNFDFWNSWDPTYGFVQYVDQATAQSYGMINATDDGPATFGVEHTQVLDPSANLGRLSLRLTTRQSWTHGLFIVDLAHMPSTTCGLWPAMWTLGSSTGVWPEYGEIDIIEYVNLVPDNLMALHTSPNCTIAGSGQSGTLLTNDCGKDGGFAGCYTTPKQPNSAGSAFNDNGGGVYAMEWTSVAIRIWFFPRDRIPQGVIIGKPDPSHWPLPDSNFESNDCAIDKYFFNHSLIFNTELCGSWAGPTFIEDGCPALDPSNQWSSCNMYVAANPDAYVDAYWAVNYLAVYTTSSGSPPPPSSSLSSVIPAASTSSPVTSGGAEGRSSTPSQSLLPPTAPGGTSAAEFTTPPSSETSLGSTDSSSSPSSTNSVVESWTSSSTTSAVPSVSTPPTGPVIVFITTYVTVPPGTRVLPAIHWPTDGRISVRDVAASSARGRSHPRRSNSISQTRGRHRQSRPLETVDLTSSGSSSPESLTRSGYQTINFVTVTITEMFGVNEDANNRVF